MSIDWITVAAQIVNFLVLVWLLKRFLYRPILDGIDAREAEIAERMSKAEYARQKAEAAETEFRDRLSAIRSDQSAMIDSVRLRAERERDALLKEARERLEREQEEYRRQREAEERKYIAELHRVGMDAILSLTRKALKDLADDTFEERVVSQVSNRFLSIAEDLREAAGESAEAVATTRDPLPRDACERLKADLQKLLPETTLRFRTDVAQSPGLVLRLGGVQVAWTVDSYIDGLEAQLEEELPPTRKGKARSNDR